jgi:hypothetical protein
MFAWLRRLMGRERRIFRYFDGREYRWADPLVIHRSLARAGDWFALIGSLKAASQFGADRLGPELAAKALNTDAVIEELAGIVRTAFEIEPVHTAGGRPAGLSDFECLELLTAFVGWLKDVEAENLPLSKRPSASPASHPADSDTGEWSLSPSPAPESAVPMPK